MRLSLWMASLWPGSAWAWRLGRWQGLALAVAFAVVVNGALIATFADSRGLSAVTARTIASIGWVSVLGLWALGLVWLRRDWPRLSAEGSEKADAQTDGLFRQAQHEYLKGHWIEAEILIGSLLARRPADVEATLLLASIQRRSKRWREAKRTLHDLQQMAEEEWLLEIGVELEQIEESESEECEMRSTE